MARFRATIKGQRGQASRLGSLVSGIEAKVNGWDVGVSVSAVSVNGHDYFAIYATGGSHAAHTPRKIGSVYLDTNGVPIFKAHKA